MSFTFKWEWCYILKNISGRCQRFTAYTTITITTVRVFMRWCRIYESYHKESVATYHLHRRHSTVFFNNSHEIFFVILFFILSKIDMYSQSENRSTWFIIESIMLNAFHSMKNCRWFLPLWLACKLKFNHRETIHGRKHIKINHKILLGMMRARAGPKRISFNYKVFFFSRVSGWFRWFK